jgi:hypothetical protein
VTGASGTSDWLAPGSSTGNFNLNGGLDGGTVGVNWQAGGFVSGIEGDFDAVE